MRDIYKRCNDDTLWQAALDAMTATNHYNLIVLEQRDAILDWSKNRFFRRLQPSELEGDQYLQKTIGFLRGLQLLK